MRNIIIATALTATLLSGCTTDGVGTKQGIGTLGGAAAGGLLGSQIGGGSGKLAATAAGTPLGAFLCNEGGSFLHRVDEGHPQRAGGKTPVAKPNQKIGLSKPEKSPPGGGN